MADNTENQIAVDVEKVQDAAQEAAAVSGSDPDGSEITDADVDADADSGDAFDKFKKELSKKNSENQTLRQRVKDSESRAQQAEMKLLRREVADELKVPSVLADRLHGATREDLVKDAEALMEGLRSLNVMGLAPRSGVRLGDSLEASSSFNGNYDELAANLYK